MKKKTLLILIAAVLALVLAAVLVIAGLSQDKPEGTLPPNGKQPTIEQPTIGVEETEPSFGSGGEIDFDDLIEAGNAG